MGSFSEGHSGLVDRVLTIAHMSPLATTLASLGHRAGILSCPSGRELSLWLVSGESGLAYRGDPRYE